MQRSTTLAGIQISLANASQNAGALPVQMTTIQIITDAQGNQVGYPAQQQTQVIASDLTPDLVAAINSQLAYLGVHLVAREPADA